MLRNMNVPQEKRIKRAFWTLIMIYSALVLYYLHSKLGTIREANPTSLRLSLERHDVESQPKDRPMEATDWVMGVREDEIVDKTNSTNLSLSLGRHKVDSRLKDQRIGARDWVAGVRENMSTREDPIVHKTNTTSLNLPLGRHHVDVRLKDQPTEATDWVAVVREDINLFLYSAFFDDRMLGGRLPVPYIVAIGVWYRTERVIYCGLWMDQDRLLDVSIAEVHAIWEKKRVSKSNATFVMHCPVFSPNNSVPKFLSIDVNSTRVQGIDSAKIPIEVPPKPQRKLDLAICLKSVYSIPGQNVIPPQFVVEWIELNKLLGVEHIFVYNHSMDAHQSDVFRYYARKHFVDIFSQANIPGYDIRKDAMPDLIASSNDCLFRLMHTVRKIVHIDLDEIIAGYNQNTLPQLLLDLSKAYNVSVKGTSFQFANQRYFLDDPRIKPGPLFSQFAVRHVLAEAPDVRPKSIVDTGSCLGLNSHFCERHVPGTRVIQVPTDIAASRHYKACESSRWESKPKNCSEAFLQSTEDRSMQRFRKQLERNVNAVLADMEKLKLGRAS